MSKFKLYLLGLITLVAFPALALVALYFFAGQSLPEVLQLHRIMHIHTFYGFLWGIAFAVISGRIFNSPFFENELNKQKKVLLSLRLNFTDKVFLSFCAGFGEEVLFRSGVQHWLGIWITSVFFIAIHGYLNPKKWKLAIYGLFLIPFIISLGYALEPLGLWFCIAAHMAYDLVIFLSLKENEEQVFFRKVRL
ncbi:MAG: type II CAAX prenyl endopeptidase Rce1 family protein [Bacteroidota bacterium]